MCNQHVALYLCSSRSSRTPFLGRFRYGTAENFTTFRAKVLLTCPEIRECDWKMHWVDNNQISHEIEDDSSFFSFEIITFRRPKNIFITMQQLYPNRNPRTSEPSFSNYLSGLSNRQICVNTNLNDHALRWNHQRNGNQQGFSNQDPHIERSQNIMTSAMEFRIEGNGHGRLLEAGYGDISRDLELLELEDSIPVPL